MKQRARGKEDDMEGDLIHVKLRAEIHNLHYSKRTRPGRRERVYIIMNLKRRLVRQYVYMHAGAAARALGGGRRS